MLEFQTCSGVAEWLTLREVGFFSNIQRPIGVSCLKIVKRSRGITIDGDNLLRLLNDFDISSDVDGFADKQAAVIESFVPSQSEINSVDCAREFERADGLTPRAFRCAFESHIKFNALRYAVHSQVADEFILIAVNFFERLALEHNRRIFCDVKKVRAFQMSVALFIFGVDAGSVDRERNFSVGEVVALGFEFAVELLELSCYFGNDKVRDVERHIGV